MGKGESRPWRFVDLSTVTFGVDDLRSLPPYVAALLVSSSLAVNEIQILQRLQLLTMNAKPMSKGRSPTELVILLQALSIDRILSSKLFEYCKLIGRGLDAAPALWSDPVTARNELDTLRSGRGFAVAKWMRNKVGNHLDLEEANSLIATLEPTETFSFLLHEQQWNTWHPIGDQLLSFSGLKKFGDPGSTLKDWHDWIDDVAAWLMQTHNHIANEVLERWLPTKVAIGRREIVDSDLVGATGISFLPIFWDTENGMDR